MVDILSGGRLDVGVGRGNRPVEFEGYRVPQIENRERFEESLEIMLRAWTKERFSFEGRHFKIPEVRVIPKPLQQPHPPVYVVCVSPDTIEATALRGLPMLNSILRGTLEPLVQQRDTYVKACRKAGPRRRRDRQPAGPLGRVAPHLRGADRCPGAGRGPGRGDVVPGGAAPLPHPRATSTACTRCSSRASASLAERFAHVSWDQLVAETLASGRPIRWPRKIEEMRASASARCSAG